VHFAPSFQERPRTAGRHHWPHLISAEPPAAGPSAALHDRIAARRTIADQTISLAHLLGRRVLDAAGSRVRTVSDLVVRWDANVTYPPVVGILVGVGRGFAFVDLQDVKSTQTGARLRSEQQTVSRPVRGESEVALARDVTAVPAFSTTNLITRPATRMVP
jgi:sporulation protein YlmC with PRC-barrel domain